MPDNKTLARAKKDLREGKARSTAAGEFVKEEIRHVRKGKHGARSAAQAIAIGLSKARRAGILPPRAGEKAGPVKKPRTAKEKRAHKNRAAGALRRLKRAPTNTTSTAALSAHGKAVAKRKRDTRAKRA